MPRSPILLTLFLVACSSSSAPQPAAPSGGEPAGGDAPMGKVAAATVYDASGQASACEVPQEKCEKIARDPDFLDRCRLASFQVRQCGCRMVCSGKVTKQAEFYGADGSKQACAPEGADCAPQETSARFQDACEAGGHKLVRCGCDWLCNGPLGTPPPSE